jgi:hypothetical protein
MEFEIMRDEALREIRFRGCITDRELLSMQLDGLERMTIDAKAENAADYLQSLEILYRRYAEQNQASNVFVEEVAPEAKSRADGATQCKSCGGWNKPGLPSCCWANEAETWTAICPWHLLEGRYTFKLGTRTHDCPRCTTDGGAARRAERESARRVVEKKQ